MIAHHDELTGIPPAADSPILAAVHVLRDVLEVRALALSAEGWHGLTITPCRACAEHVPLPIAV